MSWSEIKKAVNSNIDVPLNELIKRPYLEMDKLPSYYIYKSGGEAINYSFSNKMLLYFLAADCASSNSNDSANKTLKVIINGKTIMDRTNIGYNNVGYTPKVTVMCRDAFTGNSSSSPFVTTYLKTTDANAVYGETRSIPSSSDISNSCLKLYDGTPSTGTTAYGTKEVGKEILILNDKPLLVNSMSIIANKPGTNYYPSLNIFGMLLE